MGFFLDLMELFSTNSQKANEAIHASNEYEYNKVSEAASNAGKAFMDAITPDVKSPEDDFVDGFGDFVDGFGEWQFKQDHPTLSAIKDWGKGIGQQFNDANRVGVQAEGKVVQGVGDSLYNYGAGAVQGYQEVAREQNAFDAVSLYDSATGSFVPKEGHTQEEVDQARALLDKANSNFRNETVYPGIMALGVAAAPFTAGGSLAAEAAFGLQTGEGIYKGTEKAANEGAGPIEALGRGVKSVWLDPFMEAVKDPELGQKLQQNPAATLANLAMGGLNVAVPFLGAYGKLRGKTEKGAETKPEIPPLTSESEQSVVDGFASWDGKEQVAATKSASDFTSTGDSNLDSYITEASETYNVSPKLLRAVIEQESSFNPEAGSNAGAYGYMQLMPDTAESLGVNRLDPRDNVMGGAKYLAEQLKKFDGDVDLALAAYNAGPEAVKKYGGVPPYEETQNYIKSIREKLNGEDVESFGLENSSTSAENDEANAIALDGDESQPETEYGTLDRYGEGSEEYSRVKEADERIPDESEEKSSPFSGEIGLDETPEHMAAMNDTKKVLDKIEEDNAKAEASPEYQEKLNSHIEETRKAIEEDINRSPLYSASDSLDFNLQLFGKDVKDAKDIARKYLSDELDDRQMNAVDQIADQHGYTSGDHLSKDIIKNKSKAEKITSDLEKATKKFAKDNLGNDEITNTKARSNAGTMKAAAMEAETLRGMGKREHTEASRSKSEAAINKRWADAEKDLMVKMEKAKGQEEINGLKSQIKELQKQHKKEISALNKDHADYEKQRKASEKQAAKEEKVDLKREWKASKDWLKSEEVSQKLARTAETSITHAKEYAKAVLSGKPIKDAIDYKVYAKQAQDAARQSEKAYRKGLYEEAAKWKDTEMVKHAMAIEAMNTYKFFSKQEKYLSDVKGQNKDLFKKVDHFNQAASLLERFGLARKDFDRKSKTESLQTWSEKMDNELGNVNIADWLMDEGVSANYKDLTRWQLKDLTDAIRNIKKVANGEKKSLAAEKGRLISEIKDEMLSELKANVKDSYKPKRKSTIENAKRQMKGLAYELETIDTIVRKMQGWDTFGSFEKFFIRPAHERANMESVRVKEITDKIKTIFSQYDKKELSKMDKMIYRDEIGISCTDKDLIGIALNYGNKGNRAKLINTRPVDFTDAKKWDEQTVIDLLQNHLTEKQWKSVQQITDTINSLWPDVEKFNIESSGFSPAKVESSPYTVTTKDGKTIDMDGGYYPLRQDPRGTLQAAQLADKQGPLYSEFNGGVKATTKNGYTKQRTNKDYSVDLDLSTINKHVTEVVHDLYFRDLVADYRRMIKDEEFQSSVRTKLGPEGLKALSDYVVNVANGESYKNVGMSGYDNVMNGVRRRAAAAAIVGRVGVITQNMANIVLYPKAIKGFGYGDATLGLLKHGLCDYIPKALSYYPAALKIRNNVYEMSPFMRDRANSPDYAIVRAEKEIFNKLGVTGKIGEFLSGLMTYTDDLIAVPMWKQAYQKEFARTADPKQAIYYADTLIKSVNGSGRQFDLSPFMRNKNGFARVLNTFYGFMNGMYNRFIQEKGMVAKNPLTGSSRFMGYMASTFVIFPVISDILSGKLPKEDEDKNKYWESEILSSPLQLFPVVRDFAPMALDYAMGIKTFSNKTPLVYTGVQDAANIAKKIASANATKQDVAESTTKAAAYLAGYPDQFNAWFWNLYDYAENGAQPKSQDVFKRIDKNENTATALKKHLLKDLDSGNTASLDEALHSGKISRDKYGEIKKESKLSTAQREVKSLPIDKAISYYKSASSDEQASIKPMISKKIREKLQNPTSLTPAQKDKLKEQAAIFNK